jgi:ribonuclease HII
MRSIAGIDEAGRGALAGPVVAAIVCCDDVACIKRIARRKTASLLRDSKTLSAAQRVVARELILSTFEHHAVGLATSQEIDAFGIAAANRIAMERALTQVEPSPDFLLIDAFTIDSGLPQWGIIDGDAKSVLIAAASILAKVARDEMMETFCGQYQGFSFERHRGYGTASHLEELQRFGPCEIHRRSFEPVRSLANEVRP